MDMTNAEIVAEYRQAKDKAAQITILADLNCTDVLTIRDILRQGGEQLPRVRLRNEQIEPLYQQGLTDKEIARQLGCSISPICTWRKRKNLPPNLGTAELPPAEGMQATALGPVYQCIDAIFAALPAEASEATRVAACELGRCLLRDDLERRYRQMSREEVTT